MSTPNYLTSTVINVEGVCCGGEVPLVKAALSSLPSITSVDVNVKAKTATIVHDIKQTTSESIRDALIADSFPAVIKSTTTIAATPTHNPMKTITFTSPSIYCKSEVSKITNAVDALRGILDVEVSVRDKTFTVEFNSETVKEEDIVGAVEKVSI